MIRKSIFGMGLALILVATTFSGQLTEAQNHTNSSRGRPKAKGEIIIKIRKGATAGEIAALDLLKKDLKTRIKKKWDDLRVERLLIGREELHGREDDVAEEFKRTGAVEIATSNSIVQPAAIPNDPRYGSSSQYHWTAINALVGWDTRRFATNILVAVCDAGFDVGHPDLAPNLVLPGYNIVTDTTELPRTENMHGTYVTGTMAAASNNGLGVAGMMWQARVLPLQISNHADGSSTRADIAECIRHAADRGAKVVNVSYSGMWNDPTFPPGEYQMIEDAAIYLRNKGGLVVAAAGNDGNFDAAAENSPNVLLVGATGDDNHRAEFSTYGSMVDVFAPGTLIFTTCPTYNWESFGGQIDDYCLSSGTSIATPQVAGLAGLIFAINPNRTPAQVQNLIFGTTKDLGVPGTDSEYSRGLINAGAALLRASDVTAPTVVITAPAANSSVTGIRTLTATASDNVKVARVEFRVNSVLVGTRTIAPYSIAWDSALVANGNYQLRATAFDVAGNSGTSTLSMTVSNKISIILDNLPVGAKDATRTYVGQWCQSGVAGS